MLDMLRARKEALEERGEQGFTLAELLIVVAIIAVLVAIAIPVFTSQLEKSREATDAANIRSAYAEVMVKAIDDNSTSSTETVNLKQTQGGWQNTALQTDLSSLFKDDSNKNLGDVAQSKTATIGWAGPTSSHTSAEGHATITIN